MPTHLASKKGEHVIRPERRRRSDVIVAVVLALVLVGGAIVMWRLSPEARTTSDVATAPIPAPPQAGALPAGFAEAWRASSGATPAPVVAGPAVVTADGSTVTGRDARTGAAAWSYTRDLRLCSVSAGYSGLDDGVGRAIALYEGHTGWCSELTEMRPDTGARTGARNPDMRPGTRLVANSTLIAGMTPTYLEVIRTPLVETLAYGDLPTPVQPAKARKGCTFGSTALTTGRVSLIERCPGEKADRLTVLLSDPEDKAPEIFSVLLPGAGATLVALTPDRAAVALPNPARLLVFDQNGGQIGTYPLDVPAADLAADPPGGIPAVQSDGPHLFWWTGTRTVALNSQDLTPLWIFPFALGPAAPYGNNVLVPVPGGLADVDPAHGDVRRVIPVERADRNAPVRIAALGDVLIEQRGNEVVGLVPAP